MDTLKVDPKFVNLIPQIVGFRTAQFVTPLLKPFDSGQALDLSLREEVGNPIQHGDSPVFLLIENDLYLRHQPFLSISKITNNI